MKLPQRLRPFVQEAEALLAANKIGHLEFSGATYQVQLFDPAAGKEGYWAFLQLGAKGHLRDAFCTCELSEVEQGCPHLAAAYLRIYNGNSSPLHRRFERSLWHALCLGYMELIGDDRQALTRRASGHYLCETAFREPLFECKGRTVAVKELLDQLFDKEKRETEETSLKFSNLTEEELQQWRQGIPSMHLRYSLSYWSDLAKWMMELQEEKMPYALAFDYDRQGLPCRLKVLFDALEASFALPKKILTALIPSLVTVDSPFAVHRSESDLISQMRYDPESGILEIVAEKGGEKKLIDEAKRHPAHQLEGWYFVPGDGFYALDRHQLLAQPFLEGEAICRLFHTHYDLVEEHLTGVQLHRDPIILSYNLHIDEAWRLHISAYLFEPGDLLLPQSRLFGSCAYIEGSGFFFVEGNRFERVETVIESGDLSDFISDQRSWLALHEGFEPHLFSLEAELSYELTEGRRLIFKRRLALIEEEGGSSKDFGAWVYLHGQGFFSKVHTASGLSIKPGTAIKAAQIPLFIRTHRAELNYIPGFFSSRCPVKSAKLELQLVGDDELHISPHYTFYPEYAGTEPLFFEEVVYIEGEGFYELPAVLRLPDSFREPLILKGKALFEFLKYGLEELTPYIDEIDPRLMKVSGEKLTAGSVGVTGRGGRRDRYSLDLGYSTANGRVGLLDLWQAYKDKSPFLITRIGFIDLTDSRYRWIAALEKERFREAIVELTALELLKIDALDPISCATGGESQGLLDELRTFNLGVLPPFAALKSHLRSYQEQGLCWLWFLYQHGLSGMLCDEMGLGKTHQAMALIAAMAAAGALTRRILVVCPTSVVYHWEEKLAEYLPSLSTHTYHGGSRSLEQMGPHHKVLLTSYGILRNDIELFKEMEFDLIIFDELQVAKNHRSRTYKALQQLKPSMRLGLTGTPIENALRELKALFDLVLPGYMPSEERFREEFIKPIERFEDSGRRDLLSRYIKPFILRRKKADVLFDLPEKIEEIAHCDLAAEQLDLYNRVLAKAHRTLFSELQDLSNPVPYIHIFAILSNLKQICDHPAVYYKDPDNYEKYQSGKWDLFVELFSEARDSDQKVVIFSQYLAMLDIFENYLKQQGIGYAAIRGSTLRRGEQISKFNNDPACQVFLGSLQAAGLGVDLTAGSVVIHYDRWWNAARENQATDRVHRIGQTRGVQVFKLVTKNSFEERIDKLIMKKARLLEEVVGIDDHNFIKQFDRDELIELLQYIDRGVL